MSEIIKALREAVQHEVRRGHRDDGKKVVEDAWAKVVTLLDAQYDARYKRVKK